MPIDANSRLSVSSCRTSRRRPQPSASLRLNSDRRHADRASNRLATFAHAMISTAATIAMMIQRGVENFHRTPPSRPVAAGGDADGRFFKRRSTTRLGICIPLGLPQLPVERAIPACAWATPIPGFKRAIDWVN